LSRYNEHRSLVILFEEKALKAALLGFAALMFLASCTPAPPTFTQEEVVRRTQEMFDAVAPGNKNPWKEYFADDAMYFDEQGHNMDKVALVASIEPLPKGVTGTIKIQNSKLHVDGDTAIHSYDMDESETVQGQPLHARYHATDTWLYRNQQWKIVAGQVLRYYEDPAPGQADVSKFKAYAGAYELTPEDRVVVSEDNGKLYLQRGADPKVELVPESCDIFFRRGIEGRRLFHFTDGKVDSMIDRRDNEDIVWKKVE
jgi:hypothetical protein